MLSSLLIRNYALIDHLQIGFDEKFTTLTGETGAGKSIILGALSLILGQRFDYNLLNNKDKKCIVEGVFSVPDYIKPIFEENDLDYEKDSVFRREIAPSGKSRAFVNDTPVNLNLLKEITERIVDIHSQHHTLKLKDLDFQLEIIDSFAENKATLTNYKNLFAVYKEKVSNLEELTEKSNNAKKDLDYFLFQYEQLNSVNLKTDEFLVLEEEHELLIHSEEIKSALYETNQLISSEGSILEKLKDIQNKLQVICNYYSDAKIYIERLDSIYIELKDVSDEAFSVCENIDHNPEKIVEIEERLNSINDLFKKHNVSTIDALIGIREEYKAKIDSIESFDQKIDLLTKEIESIHRDLNVFAEKMYESRKMVIPEIEKVLVDILKQLGIPQALIRITIISGSELKNTGKDSVSILFSANKDSVPQDIAKVASGGELSRLMLAIKAMISKFEKLPTMIFDEIDMGVSGEIADKMGNIMKGISLHNQVISITHLPQIASKGDAHFMVYKMNVDNKVETKIKSLNKDERIAEVAKMLSGDKISDAAIANAKELLGA